MKTLWDHDRFHPLYQTDPPPGGGGGGDDDDDDDSKPKFNPITSQEDFDKRISSRLARQEQKLRGTITEEVKAALKAAAEADEAKEQGEYKKLYDELLVKHEEQAASIKKMERNTLVSKVASKYHLSETLAARLQGDDEDSLEADAKLLAKEVPPAKAPPKERNNDAGAGVRDGEGNEGDRPPGAKEQVAGRKYVFQGEHEVNW